MTSRFVLCNGRPSLTGKVEIDADDEALLLGRGAFETLRTYGGRLFGVDQHMERLNASCMALGIPLPDEDLVVDEMMAVSESVEGESVVRVTLTASGARIVRASPLPGVPSPFRCVTRQWVPPFWLDGTVKHTSRAFSRMAVLDAGVEEVIWVDGEGYFLEGTRSNIVAVVDGALITPPVDGRLLAGVTRSAVIEAASDAGISVALRPIHIKDAIDELYVCSTLKELTPVDELNGQLAPGSGPVGERVILAFHRAIRSG